ncbi:hypothetical protein GGS24DRAFT_477216, partial [Hypoxylon argillaceum]
MFLVKSAITPMKVRLWRNKEGNDELKKAYPSTPDFDEKASRGGFRTGRALEQLALPISTCGGRDRPPILYRVVHDGQPHGGMKARGFGLVKVTHETFQVLFDKHI